MYLHFGFWHTKSNAMVRLSFQPSLSLLDASDPTFRATSALRLASVGILLELG
jgi:hypothetical protein